MMRLGRSVSAALLAFSSLFSFAVDKKQLAAAAAAVDANLKTPAGKAYDQQIGSELAQKNAATIRQCKQLVQGATPAPFDLFLKISADGKVGEVLVYPETQVAQCARAGLLTGKFSPPPHADYWVNIHLQFKR
jgi:hypothetical protein